MKWFMAIAVVLTVPVMAYGAATFTLTSGGSAAITVDPGVAFPVELGITHDFSTGVPGFDVGPTASTDDVFKMISRTVGLAYWNPNSLDKTIFTNNPDLKTAALSGQNLGGTYNYPGYYWTAEPLATQTIQMSGDTPGVHTLSLGQAGAANVVIQEALPGQTPASQNGFTGPMPTLTVTITPEPASMLLLVGALPFLRRRRSA